MGQTDNAISYYQKALEGDSEFALAHNGMAIALFSKHRYKDAEFHFKKASEIEPDNTDFLINLARLYQFLNDYKKCFIKYEEAININPKDTSLHFDLGNILLKQGDLKKAMFHFSEVIRLDPNNAEAYYAAGIIFAKSKMYEKAEKFFLKALEINPNYLNARNSLKELNKIKNNLENPKKSIIDK